MTSGGRRARIEAMDSAGEDTAERARAYVAAQVAVKKKYGLWVTSGEKAAMKKVLTGCPDEKLPSGGNPTKAPERFHAR